MHVCITIKYDTSIRLQYSNTEAAKDLLTHLNANKIYGRNHTYQTIASSHSKSHFFRDFYCKISEELFSKQKECNEMWPCTLKT